MVTTVDGNKGTGLQQFGILDRTYTYGFQLKPQGQQFAGGV
jgi:hypothetical protein|tara:strand:- start:31 stop:153 length:123 start_codon:yes stop_codon:yes gene_type:complete